MSFDAAKVLSRKFVLWVGTIYLLILMWLITERYALSADEGTIWLSYAGHTLTVRAVKRSILTNILILLSEGLMVLFQNKEQEKLLFVKENVPRSLEMEDKEAFEREMELTMHSGRVVNPLSAIEVFQPDLELPSAKPTHTSSALLSSSALQYI